MYFLYTEKGLVLFCLLFIITAFYISAPGKVMKNLVSLLAYSAWIVLALLWRGLI